MRRWRRPVASPAVRVQWWSCATAVASVRGTEYLVDSADAASAVFVVEGRVAVSSRAGAGTVVIRAGQGVDVTAEYVPLVVKTWGAKRRDAALARVTFP